MSPQEVRQKIPIIVTCPKGIKIRFHSVRGDRWLLGKQIGKKKFVCIDLNESTTIYKEI